MLGSTIRAVLMLVILIGYARGAEYHVDQDSDNLVKFISDAPFEDFEGTTSAVDGFAFWPGEEFGENIDLANTKIHFEVRLATLETGIGMRDRDMREDYLETDRYPYAIYDAAITSVKKTGEGAYEVTAEGVFEVHGVKRDKTISAEAQFGDDTINIVSSFQLSLKDYDIDIPKLLFLRVNEIIEIELNYNMKFVK